MNPNETNAHGCPLRQQTGSDGILAFEALLAALPPDLRAAFEAERAARQQEIEIYVREHGYQT